MKDLTEREETRRRERTPVIKSRNVCGGLSGEGGGGGSDGWGVMVAVEGCI